MQNPENPGEWLLEDAEKQQQQPPKADRKLRQGETSVKVQIPAGIEPGDQVVFEVNSDDRQFQLEVPPYIKRREGEELHFIVAMPPKPAVVEDADAEETEPKKVKARLMLVEPVDEFLYSFIVDPNGDVPSGLIQLTETEAKLQPCSRDPPYATASQTRFEWNATTTAMKTYKLWTDLDRAF